jgi:hypothetical protein
MQLPKRHVVAMSVARPSFSSKRMAPPLQAALNPGGAPPAGRGYEQNAEVHCDADHKRLQ